MKRYHTGEKRQAYIIAQCMTWNSEFKLLEDRCLLNVKKLLTEYVQAKVRQPLIENTLIWIPTQSRGFDLFTKMALSNYYFHLTMEAHHLAASSRKTDKTYKLILSEFGKL